MFMFRGLALLGASLTFYQADPLPRPADPNPVGVWTWSWNDADGTTHKHSLEVVKAEDGKLTGLEKFDDETQVKAYDLVVEGSTVNFAVIRGKKNSRYKGTFKGADTINGVVYISTGGDAREFAWTAKRKMDE